MRGTFVVAAAMTVLAVPIRGNGQAFAPAPGGGPSKLLFGVRVLLEFESIRHLANQPPPGLDPNNTDPLPVPRFPSEAPRAARVYALRERIAASLPPCTRGR